MKGFSKEMKRVNLKGADDCEIRSFIKMKLPEGIKKQGFLSVLLTLRLVPRLRDASVVKRGIFKGE